MYGVRSADLRLRLRVSVQAGNAAGSGTEVSAATGTVTRVVPLVNKRPRILRSTCARGDPRRVRGDGRFVVTLRARVRSGRTSLPDRRVLSA